MFAAFTQNSIKLIILLLHHRVYAALGRGFPYLSEV